MFGNTGHMAIWYGERYNTTPPPTTDEYVAEDGVTVYVAEDGVTKYVPET